MSHGVYVPASVRGPDTSAALAVVPVAAPRRARAGPSLGPRRPLASGRACRKRPQRLRGPSPRRRRAARRRPDVRRRASFLLDRTSDASHNRSVFTVAGEHDAVSEGLERLVEQAIVDIDMEEHTGEHPRIGAVDVIPFVPLGDTTMDDVRGAGARRSGHASPSRFEIPVFLYAEAAARARPGQAGRRAPGPVRGAEVRDLAPTDGTRTSVRPGCTRGPAPLAVGARPFLIAWNINLESEDVELGEADRAPGPRVGRRPAQAPGERVPGRGAGARPPVRAQVSMNLLDFADHAPVEGVGGGRRDRRRGRRSRLAESELIGLAPARGIAGRRRSRRRACGPSGRGSPRCRRGGDQAARLLTADGARAAAGRGPGCRLTRPR